MSNEINAESPSPATVKAQDLLDAILPRRSPQYGPALAYLTAYMQTHAAERRLAMRALKSSLSAAEPDTENA